MHCLNNIKEQKLRHGNAPDQQYTSHHHRPYLQNITLNNKRTLENTEWDNQELTIQRHQQYWTHKTHVEKEQNVNKNHNKTQKKTKNMSHMDSNKNPGVHQVEGRFCKLVKNEKGL